jgi:TRAP-type C4-dicarboxylate transport system substrate-binding protein
MRKILVLSACLLAFSIQAKKIKVGVLAPEGTTWAKNMKKMGKEIKKGNDGEVSVKL